MYDTSEEARQKLENSVILFDKRPVHIITANGSKGKVSLYFNHLPLKPSRALEPSSKAEHAERIEDPRWDFRGIGSKLGFVQAVDAASNVMDAVHTSRVPVRHSRQGLDYKTVSIKAPTVFEVTPDWGSLLSNEGLVDTVVGKFKSASDAFKMLTNAPKDIKACPISRKLLLTWDQVGPLYLYYRMDKVAYTEDGVLFKLAKHKEYLREELVDMEGLKVA